METRFRPGQVQIPRGILLHPDLPDRAKLVWAAYQLRPRSQRELPVLTGLSRNIATEGYKRLRQVGALPNVPSPQRQGAYAAIPTDFLKSTRTTASQKMLYALLQVLPGYNAGTVTTSYRQLCEITGRSYPTIRSALHHLQDQGWIIVGRAAARGSFTITVRNPHVERQQQAIATATRRMQRCDFRGESLMREWLSLLVDSPDFEDNAMPGFLENPYTAERMQIDRFYWKHGVGYEFNGPQHYHTTQQFSDPEAVQKQKGRDLMKQGIFARRNMLLITVHGTDLSLTGMARLIPDRLPRRNLDGQELLIAYLEAHSSKYRRHSPLEPPRPRIAVSSADAQVRSARAQA